MTLHYRVITWIAPFLLGLMVAGPAWAAAPSDQLRGSIDQVLKILGDPGFQRADRIPERRAAIRKVAGDIFDFREVSMRSLGRYWQARTPAERDEFVELFRDLLERSYISKIETFSGEKVMFLGDLVDGDVATVRTKIVTPQGTEIPVDYRMLRQSNRWLTYDVTIEGISLVANYRTQFNTVIQRSSYAELVKKLREKQEEGRRALPAKRESARPSKEVPEAGPRQSQP